MHFNGTNAKTPELQKRQAVIRSLLHLRKATRRVALDASEVVKNHRTIYFLLMDKLLNNTNIE